MAGLVGETLRRDEVASPARSLHAARPHARLARTSRHPVRSVPVNIIDWLPEGATGTWVLVAITTGIGAAFLCLMWLTTPSAPDTGPTLTIDDLLKQATRDRRGAPRRKGNTVEVQVKAGDADPVQGWILDRSAGGVCILVEKALPAGTPLRLRGKKATEHMPWTEAVVKSCRPEGTQHELGCEFNRTPNWSLLLQFG